MRKFTGSLLVILAFAAAPLAVFAATSFIQLNQGDSATIECLSDNLTVTQESAVKALAVCSAAVAVPTNTPAPIETPTETPIPVVPTNTPEPTPTPTHDHSGHMDQADLRWHAPGAHGDRPFHEHGDPVPQWVLDAGYDPQYTHVGNTPGENHSYWKHTGFKGWAGRFNNQDWYAVLHLDINPGGHDSRFHSFQFWVRDGNLAVSHFHGWLDFGVGNNTGPNKVITCGVDSTIRPIIKVNQVGCPVTFENWYAAPALGGRANWMPDFGFNINPNYFAGGDILNPATWTPTGGIRNTTRRIEIAWYANRSDLRGEFWSTQFGDLVSGPSDPLCGTTRSYGDKTYTIACLKQTIQPTLQSVQFPGNAIQRTFPGNGVQFPN